MGPAFLRLWLPWTQEPPRGASPEGHPAPPLWMTTVSSHEAHGVSTLTLTFSTSRIPGEEPCGTVVCTESSFGWRVLGVQWPSELEGSCPLLPSPGEPFTPDHRQWAAVHTPTQRGTSLPRCGHPSREQMPRGSGASLRSGRSHTRPHVARGRRLCVGSWA